MVHKTTLYRSKCKITKTDIEFTGRLDSVADTIQAGFNFELKCNLRKNDVDKQY